MVNNTVLEPAFLELQIQELESQMLRLPQVKCDVIHRFGPGIYIREVSIPSGSFSIGHYQKQEHLNILLKGRVTMFDDDGNVVERTAPFMYIGKPGRKIGIIHEDMVWQNIYATTETDIEKLESMFLEKSETWKQANPDCLNLLSYQSSRNDFKKMIDELGITEDVVRTQSENTSDQIPFSYGSYKVMVSDSAIEGKGLFATGDIQPDEIIAPARISGKRTPAGRYTNHSPMPNAKMVLNDHGDIYLTAITFIEGCYGGKFGQEITVDYRESIRIALCQA